MRLPVPNLLLCHWSNQLFDLRSPLSTDVLILLLKQPIITCSGCLLWSSIIIIIRLFYFFSEIKKIIYEKFVLEVKCSAISPYVYHH